MRQSARLRQVLSRQPALCARPTFISHPGKNTCFPLKALQLHTVSPTCLMHVMLFLPLRAQGARMYIVREFYVWRADTGCAPMYKGQATLEDTSTSVWHGLCRQPALIAKPALKSPPTRETPCPLSLFATLHCFTSSTTASRVSTTPDATCALSFFHLSFKLSRGHASLGSSASLGSNGAGPKQGSLFHTPPFDGLLPLEDPHRGGVPPDHPSVESAHQRPQFLGAIGQPDTLQVCPQSRLTMVTSLHQTAPQAVLDQDREIRPTQ